MSGGNSKPNDHFSVTHMGVSKKRAIPKWMVYTGNPYFLMDDLGVPKPTISGNGIKACKPMVESSQTGLKFRIEIQTCKLPT